MYGRFLFALYLCFPLFASETSVVSAADAAPDFEKEIVPLLINRCLECHQEQNASGNLVLTTRAGLLKGGDSGPALDLNTPLESYLLERVHAGEMPPEKQGRPQPLPAAERTTLKHWIQAGAPWPEARHIDLFERSTDLRAGRDWWSLQPIKRPAVPQLKTFEQPANPIDAFILQRLEDQQMTPAPLADKRTRLRRLYYDLTGLPPTLAEVEAFEHDATPQAWEQQIERLLNSPQYGERWGRYWLDLVRFADTSGYERDQEKPFAWKYRDWVVDSLNADLPYDQFILQQLAGDEIPDRSERSVIATGFLRLGTWNDEPNDPQDYQYDRLEDLVHTTSSAFLGMTVKCARCHSHKFDPITQEDYYRMASAFWAGPVAPADRGLLGGPSPEQLGFKEVLGWTDLSATPRALHILKNGERLHPLQKVKPASLSMVPRLEQAFTPPPEGSPTSKRRLQMARWITHPDHPLTARVLVNRLWQHHFGAGIVRTPNNLGFLADPPTHPELLDWLAAEFQSGGWTLKRMHKLILTSQTWQQSSLHPQQADYRERDSGNRLWWRAERRRLDAEALRDSMLERTGELDLHQGGPGFRPTISAEALEGLSRKDKAWQASPPEEQKRRSLYTYAKRGLLPPMMTTFDLCDTTQSCGKRDVTTVPTQSLALLNNRFVHDRSEALAVKICQTSTKPEDRVKALWERVYARSPGAEEQKLALQHLLVQTKRFREQKTASPADEPEAAKRLPPQILAVASLCHVLFNSNEFLYVD
ncbi:PSD1 and planctomycete cytochrome C domain-containing protein [Gimesia panareensis]|uniref:PSD1 and planctomycete cytochrome C domain-containing protein n=1 Tax=Gimesia panareensis TaxID=2527978 RepID=UPI00118A3DCC|nr:PSD1 and planctomycete cytochrome C domain-containing protein [Gimesia panareensis]QDU48477.1 Planctomycete cytochrome C [Gimesia panareensis]